MTDLIRRNDALDILCKSCGISEDVEKCRKTSANGWCKEYCELKNLPTVDAKPVIQGHWEFGENEYGDDGYYCSACHGHVVWKYDTESVDFIKEYNYCPFCCAKMDEGAEE